MSEAEPVWRIMRDPEHRPLPFRVERHLLGHWARNGFGLEYNAFATVEEAEAWIAFQVPGVNHCMGTYNEHGVRLPEPTT